MKHPLRLLYTLLVFARYRALLPIIRGEVNEDIAKKPLKLARAFEKLGPSFIKLGQTLSTRPDIIGEHAADDLAKLQDKLPPFPSPIAIAQIEYELGKPLEELFLSFNEKPVAAASIAQVHQAITKENKPVAVKVLRPSVEKAFARDIAFFYWCARWIERLFPQAKRLKPREVVDLFAQSVKIEMDFRFEAAAASELKANTKKDKHLYVPDIDWRRTSQRVLTLEWVEGISIYDRDALMAQGHDLREIASRLAVTFFNQAYRDGFFHADLHPGNVFVGKDGEIIPVDFGIMGRLDHENRLYVAQILQGFLERDYRKVAKIHIRAGYVPPQTSVELFAQACRSIGEPIVGLPTNQISVGKLLSQLFKITEDFAMETQPQLLLLQKTLVLVEGLGARLDPEINMWKLAEPWIKNWAIEHLGPEAQLRDGAKRLYRAAGSLPSLITTLERVTYATAREGFRLHPDTVKAMVAERRATSHRYWIHWLIGGMIGAGVGILVMLTWMQWFMNG
jgi:ubiquinone biosynthesis protein